MLRTLVTQAPQLADFVVLFGRLKSCAVVDAPFVKKTAVFVRLNFSLRDRIKWI